MAAPGNGDKRRGHARIEAAGAESVEIVSRAAPSALRDSLSHVRAGGGKEHMIVSAWGTVRSNRAGLRQH